MTQKMDSLIDAAMYMRGGINSLLRSTVSGGTPPSLAGVDLNELRAKLLAQQEVLDDLLALMRYRYNEKVWKAAHNRVYAEGDLRYKQAEKIHEDRIAANGGKSIQDSGPAVVDCDC